MDFFSMLLNKVMSPSGNTSSNELDVFRYITSGTNLFKGATSFLRNATVTLTNATSLNNAFSNWNNEPIPIVEELTVNAPNIDVSATTCLAQAFNSNQGVKKVVLKLPDGIKNMQSTFAGTVNLKELVLNFSTKNNQIFNSTFQNSGVETISGVLDYSSATTVSSLFWGCKNLIEVTFAPNTLSISTSLSNSANLSADSIQSIIDGLATVETAQNLTLHTAVVAKLTEEQVAQIADKNWNIQ